jgi:hypothetical protein
MPGLLFVLAGFWLCVANGPGMLETACWLDRRFDLHEQLGTALEQGRGESALAGRQLTAAMDIADRLPAVPMYVRQRGPWALACAFAVAGGLGMLINGQATPTAQPAFSSITGAHAPATLAVPLAHVTPGGALQVRSPGKLPSSSARPGAGSKIRADATNVPLLSSSLQVRLGPDSVPVGHDAHEVRTLTAAASGRRLARYLNSGDACRARRLSAGFPGLRTVRRRRKRRARALIWPGLGRVVDPARGATLLRARGAVQRLRRRWRPALPGIPGAVRRSGRARLEPRRGRIGAERIRPRAPVRLRRRLHGGLAGLGLRRWRARPRSGWRLVRKD